MANVCKMKNEQKLVDLKVSISCVYLYISGNFNDTHREKAPSNKTPVLMKSMNMEIWVVGTSNQFFIRSFYAKTKNNVVTEKTLFFVIVPFFSPHLS